MFVFLTFSVLAQGGGGIRGAPLSSSGLGGITMCSAGVVHAQYVPVHVLVLFHPHIKFTEQCMC